jgi:branched-chain amino acid transport system ATP-binding protein
VSATAEPILELEEVSKAFGGIAALRGVSLAVRRAECVALIGANGAGKSTLVACISGQLTPDRGSIRLAGAPIGHLAPFRRARLGLACTFQELELFAELRVDEHLLVAMRARHGHAGLWRDLLGMSAPSADERAQIRDVLTMVGLEASEHAPIGTLTLGSCRMLELARAVVTGPRLLLADEPSSGLDPDEVDTLAAVLASLRRERGVATVLVEHDLGLVRRIADQVAVLDGGELVALSTFDDVMADPVVRRAYLGRLA